MRRIAAQVLRLMPPALAFAAIEGAAPGWARIGLRAGGVLLPRRVRAFPERAARLLGARDREERARLVGARLVFLLIRAVVNQVLLVRGAAESRRLLPIEVTGAHHLEAALAERRGLVLASAHFGLPPLLRLLLEDRGLEVIGVGGSFMEHVDVATGGDVWTRARALQRVRSELRDGRACTVLADARRGRHVEVPFLRGRISVASGAFGLAQVTECPLLPAFAVHTAGAPRFRVAFGPPLPVARRSGTAALPEAVAAFTRCYETVAVAFPGHLFGYDPLFGPRNVSG